ncbi:MAG: tetratricopeptide repeat protein [Planctomycetota bacterium]
MAQHRYFKLKLVVVLVLFCGFCGIAPAGSSRKQTSTKMLRSMARAYMAFGKYEKAHVHAKRALKQARLQQVEDGEMALCLIDMGTVCSYEGLLDQARKHFEAGVNLQEKALSAEHPYVAHTLRMLSGVYRRQDDMEQAEDVLSQAVQIMLEHCDVHSKEMAPFILESAKLKFAKGQLENAFTNYQAALDIYEQNYGARHLMTANVLEDMAHLCIAQKDAEKASELMSEALTIKKRIFGRYHPSLIDSWLTMARICKYRGQTERCEYYLVKSTETASLSRNAITMARVYEQANQIRKAGLVASAISVN